MSNEKQFLIPSYRRHKASGQAVVTLNDKDFYLGLWRSTHSKVEYQRLVGEWLADDRRLPPADGGAGPPDMTISELAADYWSHAEGYYVKDGQPTSELCCIKSALRPLKRLYAHTVAGEFGPLALKSVRQQMIDLGPRAQEIIRPFLSTAFSTDCAKRTNRIPASTPSHLRYGKLQPTWLHSRDCVRTRNNRDR